jgi:hypothetical protein
MAALLQLLLTTITTIVLVEETLWIFKNAFFSRLLLPLLVKVLTFSSAS